MERRSKDERQIGCSVIDKEENDRRGPLMLEGMI